MKFIEARPFTDPDAAARKLLDIVRGSINESGLPHAYTGATNTAFTRAGGSIAEYSIGMKHAAAQKSFEVDRSGTRIILLARLGGVAMFRQPAVDTWVFPDYPAPRGAQR
jgi:hypothetical protein